jgi:hypothetical protein
MATHSTISVELDDQTIISAYCHFDGYVSYNGRILVLHYSDRSKAIGLVKLGAMRSLNDDGFSDPYSEFYHREFTDFSDYLDNLEREEYNYLMRKDGLWYVETDQGFKLVTEQIVIEEFFSNN